MVSWIVMQRQIDRGRLLRCVACVGDSLSLFSLLLTRVRMCSPVVNGRKQKSCWSHPGSYLGELGLKTKAGDRIHLVTGPAKRGFDSVTVNEREVRAGESVALAGDLGSVSRNTTHLASVQVGNWDFAFENSDLFVNQRVRVLDQKSLRSHGLLGQTWRDTTYPNAIKHIAGQVDDYVIRDNDIFGDNFVFNAFN